MPAGGIGHRAERWCEAKKNPLAFLIGLLSLLNNRRKTGKRSPLMKTPLALVLTLIVCLPSVAASQTETGTPGSEDAAGQEQGYVVGISDVLRVSVWKNDELEAEVPVRPDGRISLLLIGDVDVAGLTTEHIRQVLTRRYEQFVNAPGVSVMLTEINSRKFYVLGEITEPGAYDLALPTRLLQALAMAGGLTEFAKKDHVILLRDIDGTRQRYMLNLKMITSGNQPENDVILEPGDTIFVP